MTSTDIGVAEAGTEPAGQSLSRGATTPARDALRLGRPGRAHARARSTRPVTPEPPPTPAPATSPPTHEIGEVQGDGATTPLAGQQVTVRGVVVGDVPGFSGFYLQDADGDGDAATSDGIFVFSPVAVGPRRHRRRDRRGAGVRRPDPDQRRASDVDGVRRRHRDDLPAAGAARPAGRRRRARARSRACSSRPVDTLTVSEVFDLTSFGELTLSEGGLLVQPTELARPGTAEAAGRSPRSNTLRRDRPGRRRQRPGERRPPGPTCRPTTPVRVGDELAFTEPLVLGYGFNALAAAAGRRHRGRRLRAAEHPARGARRRSAATSRSARSTCSTTSSPDRRRRPRRDAAPAEFERAGRQDRAGDRGAGRRRRDADGDRGHRLAPATPPATPTRALADLVRRLNAAAGADKWAYVPLPDELLRRRPGRHPQRDHLPARRRRSRSATRSAWSTRTVWFNAREPIAQTFVKDGDAFTVVANHFKSKSAGRRRPATTPTPATGRARGTATGSGRRASLAAFADELRAQTGDADVLLLGDFNAYTQEDPIERLRDGRATSTSASGSTRAGTATCSTTCPARWTTPWPPRR